MGRMKEYLSDLGIALHEGDFAEIREELKNSQDPTWLIRQVCALRTAFEGETGMFLEFPEPEMLDGFFIGGEGSPEIAEGICAECFWHYRPLFRWRKDPEWEWLKATSPYLSNGTAMHHYFQGKPIIRYSPQRCGCGNYIFTKIGHDALFAEVAAGNMFPEIAVQYINRMLSFGYDPRAFLAANAGFSEEEWND